MQKDTTIPQGILICKYITLFSILVYIISVNMSIPLVYFDENEKGDKDMALEDNIKYFRKEKGLSQKELGEIIGVAQKQISQYESGQRRPDCFNIVYLARALGTTAEELVEITV